MSGDWLPVFDQQKRSRKIKNGGAPRAKTDKEVVEKGEGETKGGQPK